MGGRLPFRFSVLRLAASVALSLGVTLGTSGCGSSPSGNASASTSPVAQASPRTENCNVNLEYAGRFPGTDNGTKLVTVIGGGSSAQWEVDTVIKTLQAGIGSSDTSTIQLRWSHSTVSMSINFGDGISGYATNPRGLSISEGGKRTTFRNVEVDDSVAGGKLDTVNGTVDCSQG